MSTLSIIILVTLVIGFISRVVKLYKLTHRALYYERLNKNTKSTMTHSTYASVRGICLSCVCFFVIIPVFLFIKTSWWIPIVAIISGLTIGNLIGLLVEKLFCLPNHTTIDNSFVDLNAMELNMNDGLLFRRTVLLMFVYSIISIVLSLRIILFLKL